MKTEKPDYQLLRNNGWKNAGGMAACTGCFFKPVRMFTLPEERGSVTLMESMGAGDRWSVYSLDEHDVPSRSAVYDDRALGEGAFHELCHRLVHERKDKLVRLLSEPEFELVGADRAEAALELARLELADDELVEGIREEVRQFVSTHSLAECEELYQRELAEYDRAKATVA
jgi:hypothetical protein